MKLLVKSIHERTTELYNASAAHAKEEQKAVNGQCSNERRFTSKLVQVMSESKSGGPPTKEQIEIFLKQIQKSYYDQIE
jgi:hypothetical protein